MKLLHYFLGFNAFALAYWVFSKLLCNDNTPVTYWVYCCILFSILSTVAIYNLIQGYKLHKEEY